ncbi:unnamed protein product [Brassica napus]|uniref:(rape) hypothetical protein n=1 Tax=Brassica napus TaxID=3708 RepID=A0A816TEH0_BRANA|nr:unnamed protein product [Brassica napus]
MMKNDEEASSFVVKMTRVKLGLLCGVSGLFLDSLTGTLNLLGLVLQTSLPTSVV